MYRSLFTLLVLWLQVGVLSAQVIPNCRDLNASVDEFGQITFTLRDLVTNVDQGIDTAELSVLDELDNLIFGPARVDPDSMITLPACQYLDRTLKVNIATDQGACWSPLTVKKIFGPIIQGRQFDVYCFDSLVAGPIDDGPSILHACAVNPITPEHVTDWVINYSCEPGVQDTAKVILREWEAYDKDDLRGVGFDTIVVFLLPEVTASSIYCQRRDTVYCGDVDSLLLPFITFPSEPGNAMSTCDTLPLVEVEQDSATGELIFSSLILEDLCAVSTKVESEPFELDCHVEYKVDFIFKMECYGQPQSTCIVTPPAGTDPNGAESLAPGYWQCSFWLVDYDTVPPTIHCKKPILFSDHFDIEKWTKEIEGDGVIDTTWTPYQLSMTSNDNGTDSLSTKFCTTLEYDAVLAFAWEYESMNTDAGYDPFGYRLNDTFYRLTLGDLIDEDGPLSQTGYKIIELRAGDDFCFDIWSTDGTSGRAEVVIKPLTVVSTSGQECAAHTYIPDVQVDDDWSGVKVVKATVDGLGSFVLSYNSEKDCYESHEQIKLPHSVDPYIIYYEAQDSCHNTYLDSCYILVKDRVRPTAVINKALTVSLSEKKVWINAEDFDEGSYDNCEINLLLVRRTDWYESCVDLCDSINPICVNEHEDTLWKAYLEPDKNLDPVEAHYANQLWDWQENDWPCTNIIHNAWMYDLIKRATLHCKEHPYELSDEYFSNFIDSCFDSITNYFRPVPLHPDPYGELEDPNDFKVDQRLIDIYEQIGGGWADAVPFDCDDACGQVTVEILVMDYWCNWSTAWMHVWVEDKTPAQVVKDVEDVDITCKIYKTERYDVDGFTSPQSIATIVDLAKENEKAAFDALDRIFGGYQKVWKDPYGEYIDSLGDEVICDIPFDDSSCYCRVDTIIPVRVFDEHLGYYWNKDTIYECGYDPVYDTLTQGLVLANCSQYVYCDQEVWCEIDHCGEGAIYRKFKIWQSCPPEFYASDYIPDSIKQKHIPDTIVRKQKIVIYNECSLEKEMFDVPPDVELESCGLIYDEEKNVGGDLHPDKTGWLRYQFDDDCRLIGIDYDDKVFRIVGGEGSCYKIIRTWYYMDWCDGEPTDPYWWKSRDFEIDSCIQTLFLQDSTPPTCTINGPVENEGSLEIGSCSYDFSAIVDFFDTCGISTVHWKLNLIGDSTDLITVAEYAGDPILSDDGTMEIEVDGLAPGAYYLKVEVTDGCQNDGICEYYFELIPVKKPTPICIGFLTGKLTPWDRDQDGIADTAKVTFWASEFDQSSIPACQDTAIEFRLDLLDGVGDDIWADDADSLTFGCAHTGSQAVRLWVISYPSFTVDYCDVFAIIQSDFEGCEPDNVPPSLEIEINDGGFVKDVAVKTHLGEGGMQIGQIPGRLQPTGPNLTGFILHHNYPNPFYQETSIDFEIPNEAEVEINIYDLRGRLIRSRGSNYTKGRHQVTIDGSVLSQAGIYYYQIKAGAFCQTRKMIYMN